MKTIALVVGISEYSDPSFQKLPGAAADSMRFEQALKSWGLPAEWITHIGEQRATKAEIIKAFYNIRQEFDVEAKFIFYFAGHGIREHEINNSRPESSLILHDTCSDDLLGSSLRLVELMQLIRLLKPQQTFLFIDACRLRLNQLVNPLNDIDIFSTTNSKGFFCMLSSGVYPSYEDKVLKNGYFTTALLKAIGELRHSKQPSCHDILKRVEQSLLHQALPPPEAYHVGSSLIWPLESNYSVSNTKQTQENPLFVERFEALATLEDFFSKQPTALVWMWGEAGLGKSVIAEQFANRHPASIYCTITSGVSLSLIFQSLIEQLRSQKSELFFNRPPERLLFHTLQHVLSVQPNFIFIIDHADRLSKPDLQEVLKPLDELHIACLIVSRNRCNKSFLKRRQSELIEWQASSFSIEETVELIEQCGLQDSLSNLLVNSTHGNALKTRQMLVKLSGQATPLEGKMSEESIACITAIIACGSFLDEKLFCQNYNIRPHVVTTLVQFGLIRYSKEGCFPHDLLDDLVEENQWALDIQSACNYWNLQIKYTPFNRLACRSLTLLVEHIEDCHPYKEALRQCLETLNEREYRSFLLDLARIFQRHDWQDELLSASDSLIDHEEYQQAGQILQTLLSSSIEKTRHHAIKNEIRRLVWIGKHTTALKLYHEVSDSCSSPDLLIAMRNHIGVAYFFLGEFDLGIELFEKNLAAEKIIDEREVGIAKYMLALIYTYQDIKHQHAKQLFESSILIFESSKYYHWLIVGLNGLAVLHNSLQERKQSLIYLKKALEISDALQNRTFLLQTLKNIARVQLRHVAPNSPEISTTVEALERNLKEVLAISHNWATMWAQNILCTVYAHRMEPEKMEYHLNDVKEHTKNYDECHIFTLSNLGHYAALTHDYEKAKEYYEQAYSLCAKTKIPLIKQEIRNDFLACNLPLELQEEAFACYSSV